MVISLIFVLLTMSNFAEQVSALIWLEMPRGGTIPKDAISYVSFKSESPIHFCQVVDNTNGKIYTGTFIEDENLCNFVNTETKQVGESSKFEVLLLSQGDEMSWKWAYPGEVPENAVPCDDTILGGPPNCFLGVSLYSDGICEEYIGKIDPSAKAIHMQIKEKSEWCPFYMYLTVKQAATLSSLDLIEDSGDTNKDQYVIVV